MPRTAASDLGLCGLPMSHKKDARLKWVKQGRGMANFFTALSTASRIRTGGPAHRMEAIIIISDNIARYALEKKCFEQ